MEHARKIATCARYEASTKTIRSVPENYWLASMDSFDGAPDHEANARIMAASFEVRAAAKALLDTMETPRSAKASAAWLHLIAALEA